MRSVSHHCSTLSLSCTLSTQVGMALMMAAKTVQNKKDWTQVHCGKYEANMTLFVGGVGNKPTQITLCIKQKTQNQSFFHRNCCVESQTEIYSVLFAAQF